MTVSISAYKNERIARKNTKKVNPAENLYKY